MQIASEDFSFSIDFEDSRAKPKTAASAYKKLVQSGAKFILGGMFSASTLAFAPMAKKDNILILSPTAADKRVPETGENMFTLYPSAPAEGRFVASYAQKNLSAQKFSVITEQEKVYKSISEGFISKIKESELSIENRQTISPDSDTFRNAVTKVPISSSDAIFISGSKSFVGKIASVVREVENDDIKLLSQSTAYDESFLKNYSSSAEGMTISAPYFDVESDRKIIKDFVKKYESKYDKKPNTWSAYCFDSVRAIGLSLKKAAPKFDVGEARKILSKADWEGTTGPIKFKNNGAAKRGYKIYEIRDSAFKEMK
jgi:branched-chain amino acid transport system substrate-binding protein